MSELVAKQYTGKQLVLRFISLLRPTSRQAAWRLVLILVAVLVQMSFVIAMPMLYERIFDDAVENKNRDLLFAILAIMGGYYILTTLASTMLFYLSPMMGAEVVCNLRRSMFARLQKLGLDFFRRNKATDITNRFAEDLFLIELSLRNSLPVAVYHTLMVTGSVVLMFTISPLLTVVTIVGVLFVPVVPRMLGPRATAVDNARKEDDNRTLAIVQETVDGSAVVQAFGLQEEELRKFSDQVSSLQQKSAKTGFLTDMTSGSAEMGVVLITLAVIGVGSYQAIEGELNIGALFAFVTLLFNVSTTADAMPLLLPNLLRASAALQRVDGLLDQPDAIASGSEAGHAVSAPRGQMVLEDVRFGYEGETLALDGVSITLPAGRRVALIGRNGAGKSTLINLLARFFDPQSGRILADGVDLRQIDAERWRSCLGMVLQEPFLFDSTVRENIRVGRLGASDAEVEEAARLTDVHEMIMGLSAGYDTRVGERGSRLSSGQRQRICLARAMLRDPQLLLLDDPTSALDPVTEISVNQTLSRITQGRSVVLSTHNLQAVTEFDCILLLDRGRLLESGTHRELLDRDGDYARLWRRQNVLTVGGEGLRMRVQPERLRNIPLLANLEDDALDDLSRRVIIEGLAGDSVIFRQQDLAEKFYIIVRGQVELTIRTPKGEDRVLHTVNDGEFFGEFELVESQVRIATARTTRSTVLLSLYREFFLDLLADAPDMVSTIRLAVDQRYQQREEALRA